MRIVERWRGVAATEGLTKGAHEEHALWDGASPRAVRETGRSRRSPEGVEGRGHAQRASAAPEYRASEAQAGTKTPVRQGELQTSLRVQQGDYAELWNAVSEAD